MASLISLRDLHFSYASGLDVLKGVDFELNAGDRVALTGSNGAGKSTLLKLMLGELTPCTGNIKRHTHLKFGKYHQHSTEVLDKDATPLEFIANNRRNAPTKAIQAANKALNLARTLKDKHSECRLHNYIGGISLQKGNA